MDQIFVVRDIDIVTIIRVTVALILGGVVGFERERGDRPAGLRTHMLVAAGSACFSMASIYGFDRLTNQADLARVAASVVTGVGFLGAGTILRDGSTIRGLTSASSIWIVASIGMLSGLGMILLAVYTTFLTWFVLAVVKRFKHTPKKNPPRLVNQKGLLNPKQLSVEEHDPHED
jgi:putative Mg2+ transporter-C (MgtC) family protein